MDSMKQRRLEHVRKGMLLQVLLQSGLRESFHMKYHLSLQVSWQIEPWVKFNSSIDACTVAIVHAA